MTVGPHQGIRVRQNLSIRRLGPNHFGQVLQINLVTNPRTGRHDPKVVKRALSPSEKPIPFAVALHFNCHVFVERVLGAEVIHHNAMINDKIHRGERVNHPGIVSGINDSATHGRQIGDRGHASKILHEHARRSVGNLLGIGRIRYPIAKGTNVVGRNRKSVFET